MRGMWKTIREKLGLITKSPTPGCCGALWGSKRFSPPIDPITLGNADDVIEEIATTETAGEMNLAAALAEERRIREAESLFLGPAENMESTSLMNWLEEEEEKEVEEEREAVGLGESCCVCMEKKKGAAFIPCGHAFCRGCARDIWIERRSCALCNRPILEILHIF
ncbi:E3 ubiquitin-protein ligase BRE1-like [Phalaenopsis equestris]|uniref:E3 ubiquitin-protein ligase BRE1-like n=1 Tax=Phalaenopsis equestris TaxID=78828 RepID=UPI0009E21BFD|nr:E3 ubiquitin-protein ligase BRE1-like [Phalaenopsis equestris]